MWQETVAKHYESAGFSAANIAAVVRTIEANSTQTEIRTPGLDIVVPVAGIEVFCNGLPGVASDTEMQAAEHAWLFAFGYWLRIGQRDIAEHRLPGLKNRLIVEAAQRVRAKYPQLRLAAQPETADALNEQPKSMVVSSVRDQGTIKVIEEFIDALGWKSKENGKTVVIFGHRHHCPRIAMLLAVKGIRALLPPDALPVTYDDLWEKQPRVKTEEAFLWSDTVSTLAFIRDQLKEAK
jgi:hypothetical protein